MANTITGKPRRFHCGPVIQQMKLNDRLGTSTGRRQTSWLYTSATESLNQGSNRASGQSRI